MSRAKPPFILIFVNAVMLTLSLSANAVPTAPSPTANAKTAKEDAAWGSTGLSAADAADFDEAKLPLPAPVLRSNYVLSDLESEEDCEKALHRDDEEKQSQ